MRIPTEVPEVLKWSCLICSVPVAFNGVQTGVLVDAPGKSSRKYQQPSTVSQKHFCHPGVICPLIIKKWHGFCRARIGRFGFSCTQNIPSPPHSPSGRLYTNRRRRCGVS